MTRRPTSQRPFRLSPKRRNGTSLLPLAALVLFMVLIASSASGRSALVHPEATNLREKLKTRAFAQESRLKREARILGYRAMIARLEAKTRLTDGENQDLAALREYIAAERASSGSGSAARDLSPGSPVEY